MGFGWPSHEREAGRRPEFQTDSAGQVVRLTDMHAWHGLTNQVPEVPARAQGSLDPITVDHVHAGPGRPRRLPASGPRLYHERLELDRLRRETDLDLDRLASHHIQELAVCAIRQMLQDKNLNPFGHGVEEEATVLICVCRSAQTPDP